MGNTTSGDLREKPDFQRWQTSARQTQRIIYNVSAGVHFDEYQDLSVAQQISKICFAIYGQAETPVDLIENAYTEAQRETASRILDKIMEEWNKCPKSKLFIGVIFVCCKNDKAEFNIPVFRSLFQYDHDFVEAKWIDISCQVYDSWSEWENSNKMPLMKYCFPRNGYNSCLGGRIREFHADREPDIDYGTSPSANDTAINLTDVSLAESGTFLGFDSLYPLGYLAKTIVNASSNVTTQFGTAGQRMIDKANHRESMSDLESIALISSIIATPRKFINSLVNARLSSDADGNAKIFDKTSRILAYLLSSTRIHSLFFLVNLTHFIEKFEEMEPRKVDFLQFSMSCLFFENILIEPQVVRSIVTRARLLIDQNGCKYWSDEGTQLAYRHYLHSSQHEKNGNNSKTFRALTRIENDDIFKIENIGIFKTRYFKTSKR